MATFGERVLEAVAGELAERLERLLQDEDERDLGDRVADASRELAAALRAWRAEPHQITSADVAAAADEAFAEADLRARRCRRPDRIELATRAAWLVREVTDAFAIPPPLDGGEPSQRWRGCWPGPAVAALLGPDHALRPAAEPSDTAARAADERWLRARLADGSLDGDAVEVAALAGDRPAERITGRSRVRSPGTWFGALAELASDAVLASSVEAYLFGALVELMGRADPLSRVAPVRRLTDALGRRSRCSGPTLEALGADVAALGVWADHTRNPARETAEPLLQLAEQLVTGFPDRSVVPDAAAALYRVAGAKTLVDQAQALAVRQLLGGYSPHT